VATHDPAKVLTDLAVSLGLGGDCLADVAVLRAEPDLFGLVASDPTVSRLVDRLGRVRSAIAATHCANAVFRVGAGCRPGIVADISHSFSGLLGSQTVLLISDELIR
jgi:hypothetical protein